MPATMSQRRSAQKLRIPLYLGLFLALCPAALLLAALRGTESFWMAFGDSLLIEAIVLFSIAWIVYLKKDGIRLRLSPSRRSSRPAQSWKDRVPMLGAAPSPPSAIPDERGPNDPDYARLAEAEDRLRNSILGDGVDSSDNGKSGLESPEVGHTAEAGAKLRLNAIIWQLLLAGSALFALGLCFEYLIPRLFD